MPAESAEQALLQRGTEGYAADSLDQVGASVAPGAGAAIASIAAPGAGVYEITAIAGFGAVVAAGDQDNFEVRHGATVIGKIPCRAVANTDGAPVKFSRITVLAAEAISVNATGAGTAGANYRATVVATRLAS